MSREGDHILVHARNNWDGEWTRDRGGLRDHCPRALLSTIVAALMVANTLNAKADILAIAAGMNLLIPIPLWPLILPIGLAIVTIQIIGSYQVIAKITANAFQTIS